MKGNRIKVLIKGIKKETQKYKQPCEPPLLVGPDCGPTETLNDEVDAEKAALDAKKKQLDRDREDLKKRQANYKIRQANQKLSQLQPESMSARKTKTLKQEGRVKDESGEVC